MSTPERTSTTNTFPTNAKINGCVLRLRRAIETNKTVDNVQALCRELTTLLLQRAGIDPHTLEDPAIQERILEATEEYDVLFRQAGSYVQINNPLHRRAGKGFPGITPSVKTEFDWG